MRFTCASCGKHYEIPDERVTQSGALRVRCKGCRAIMAVDKGTAEQGSEDTAPDLPTLRRRRGSHPVPTPAVAAVGPALTDVHAAFERPEGLPAALSSSGVYRPVKGVERRLTGVRLDARGKDPKRVWYAAIDGTPKGPYTDAELARLARDGRVRGRTLVWRPGFEDWARVRSREHEREDLQWLRDVVVARKAAEVEASRRATAAMGIHPIVLDHRDLGELPPALPLDAHVEVPLHLATLDPAILSEERARPRHRVLEAALAGALLGSLLVVVLLYTFPVVMRFWGPH